jgi:hypothetical protein
MLGFSFDLRRRNARKTVAGAASHRVVSNIQRNHGQRSLSPPTAAAALTSATGGCATCSTAASLTSNASLGFSAHGPLALRCTHGLDRRGQFRLIQCLVTILVEFRDHAFRQGFRIGDGAAHATARGFALATFSFQRHNRDDIFFTPSKCRYRRHGRDGGSSREQSA